MHVHLFRPIWFTCLFGRQDLSFLFVDFYAVSCIRKQMSSSRISSSYPDIIIIIILILSHRHLQPSASCSNSPKVSCFRPGSLTVSTSEYLSQMCLMQRQSSCGETPQFPNVQFDIKSQVNTCPFVLVLHLFISCINGTSRHPLHNNLVSSSNK